MFAVGQVGRLGRLLASSAGFNLTKTAMAILAKYGSAANLYLPGVGAINGIAAGNWLDSTGTVAATVDGQVGLVVSAVKELGPELRGNFVIDKSGIAPNATYNTTTGAASVTRGGILNQSFIKITGLDANGTYVIVLSTDASNTNTIGVRRGGFSGTIIASVAAGTTSTVYVTGDSSFFITSSGGNQLANVSTFRLAPGAHLTQSIAANRTILRQSGGFYNWDFVSSVSFTSTMTPGNAGFFCASANVTDSGVLRTLLGAGAGSDASSGVWLARQVSSNLLMLQVGNGTTRNSIGAPYPVATNAVASAGWDSSAMFVGINNTETSGAKSVDCTSANTMNLGVLTGTTNPMLGTIGSTIIMPTVLPTSTERATLRQFIASLSGVTL
jgi:hypothetical protein